MGAMINVSKVKVKEGGTRYVVNVRINGRRKRKYFATKKEADNEASRLDRERRAHGDQFASLGEVDRAELVVAFDIGEKLGFSVIDAVKAFREKAELREARRVSIGDAIRRCLREKSSSIKISSYENLSGARERFGEGRWSTARDEIDRSDVYEWMEAGPRAAGAAGDPAAGADTKTRLTCNPCCARPGLTSSVPGGGARRDGHERAVLHPRRAPRARDLKTGRLH